MIKITKIVVDVRNELDPKSAFPKGLAKLNEKINEIEEANEVVNVQLSEILQPSLQMFSGYVAFVFYRENPMAVVQ